MKTLDTDIDGAPTDERNGEHANADRVDVETPDVVTGIATTRVDEATSDSLSPVRTDGEDR